MTSLISLSNELICAARLIIFKQVMIFSTQFYENHNELATAEMVISM